MIWLFLWWIVGMSSCLYVIYKDHDIDIGLLLASCGVGLLGPIVTLYFITELDFFNIVVLRKKDRK